MLNLHHLYICLHEIMDHTPWQHYYEECTKSEDLMAYQETHTYTIAMLDQLQTWLRNYYLVEVTEEYRSKFICLHSGSLDNIPFPWVDEAEWPGNEGPFYQSHGTCPQFEPMLDSAPLVTNRMIEALCHYDHHAIMRQAKSTCGNRITPVHPSLSSHPKCMPTMKSSLLLTVPRVLPPQ